MAKQGPGYGEREGGVHPNPLPASYLPSEGSDEEELELEVEELDPDLVSPDSMDEWSDDRWDSEEYEDSDSDDSAGWSSRTTTRKKKKKTPNSACEHLTVFGALRKGFCSKVLERRTEVHKIVSGFDANRRAVKGVTSGRGDPVSQARKRAVKGGPAESVGGAGGDGESERHTQKQCEGARMYSTIFKLTVADAPKHLLKRASLSRGPHRNEQGGVEDMNEKQEEADCGKKTKEKAETDTAAEAEKRAQDLKPERGVKSALDLKEQTLRLAEDIRKATPHREYGKAHVEVEICLSRTPISSNGSGDEKEEDQSCSHSKMFEKHNCWRESDRKNLDNKGEWNLIRINVNNLPDSSSKSTKNQTQAGDRVKASETEGKTMTVKDSVSIEQDKNSIKMEVLDDNTSQEVSSVAAAPSSIATLNIDNQPSVKESEANHSKPSTPTAKLQDMPLQLYKKEKQPPNVGTTDSKRKTKTKKAKQSKGKKVNLFRDGFTLPSATELDDDSGLAHFVAKEKAELNNGLRPPREAVEVPISDKEVETVSVSEDDVRSVNEKLDSVHSSDSPTYQGSGARSVIQAPESSSRSGVTMVGAVVAGESTAAVITSKSGASAVSKIKSQIGRREANEPSLPVAVVTDNVTTVLSSHNLAEEPPSFANHREKLEGEEAPTSFIRSMTNILSAAQPLYEAMAENTSIYTREDLLKTASTSKPPSSQVNRELPAALPDAVAASKSATSMINNTPSSSNLVVSQPQVTIASGFSFSNPLSSLPVHPEGFQPNWKTSTTDSTISLVTSNSPSVSVPASFPSVLGTRVHLPPAFTPSSRYSTTMNPSINAHYPRSMQPPVSQIHLNGPSPGMVPPSEQEITSSALFYAESRGVGHSLWNQPGSGVKATDPVPEFSLAMGATTPAYFGQVIGCVNKTLTLYKQMNCFRIAAKHLLSVPNIAPGTCALFLFNIETQQLYGVYESSSYAMQATSVNCELSVAFDCIEHYSLPLSIAELETVLPDASLLDGRTLYLQPHVVKHLVNLLHRKNTSRHSWGPSPAITALLAAAHNSVGSNEVSSLPVSTSFPSSTHNHLAEGRGKATYGLSANASASTTTEVTEECWSPISSGSTADFRDNETQSAGAAERAPPLSPAHILPSPASLMNVRTDTNTARTEVAHTSAVWKLPEQEAAPSPMALWPHLFPKASPADHQKVVFASSLQLLSREATNPQINYPSLPERNEKGVRADSEAEAHSTVPVSEPGVRSKSQRPKQAYNPLAVEQGRQRQLLEVSKPPSWLRAAPDHELQQSSNLGHSRQRSQENYFRVSTPSPPISEQAVEMQGFDASRNDTAFSAASGSQSTAVRNEEPHSMHIPVGSPETAVEGANLGQAHLCCYCFTRRADHLIIDCRHLGPCLECAASMKIDVCAQPNCRTQVTRLLRLFL